MWKYDLCCLHHSHCAAQPTFSHLGDSFLFRNNHVHCLHLLNACQENLSYKHGILKRRLLLKKQTNKRKWKVKNEITISEQLIDQLLFWAHSDGLSTIKVKGLSEYHLYIEIHWNLECLVNCHTHYRPLIWCITSYFVAFVILILTVS